MSTMLDTSLSTSVDVPETKPTFRSEAGKENAVIAVDTSEQKAVATRRYNKYNHLFATHSKSRLSPLTRQDQTETPNFNGFRNLMALVLGMYILTTCMVHL
jgi:hypothetical protein